MVAFLLMLRAEPGLRRRHIVRLSGRRFAAELGKNDPKRPKFEPMASRDAAFVEITPEVLLKAYACGIFPMAESADDPALYWIEPEQRGVLPRDRVHAPRPLARTPP